jgi:hypothetical protein
MAVRADAPLSRMPKEAREGQLDAMVGATKKVFARTSRCSQLSPRDLTEMAFRSASVSTAGFLSIARPATICFQSSLFRSYGTMGAGGEAPQRVTHSPLLHTLGTRYLSSH